MPMEGLPVSIPLNGVGGGCEGGWGNWGGALIGGAIGGAVGGAWNGNRWNNGQCCNNNGAYGDLFVMDSVSNMRNEIGSVGRDQLMQTAGLQSSMCQGFGGLAREVGQIGAQLSQGQCRTEAAVLTTGLNGQIQQKDNTIFNLQASHNAEVQGMRNAFELKSSIDACCCATNANIAEQGCKNREVQLAEGCATRKAIHDEGEATRALIGALDRERLLREMCAKDSEIAALKMQNFNVQLAGQSTAAIDQKLNNAIALVIGHTSAINNRTSGGSAAATPAS